MIEVVSTWDEFRRAWDSRMNFILRGDVFPYTFTSPPLAEVIEAVRQNENARIVTGKKGNKPEATSMTSSTYLDFRDLPIEQAVNAQVQLSHFELNEFTGPGQIFEPLGPILEHWYKALAEHGFTVERTQRALFLSGPDSQSNYHMDGSYIVAWQIYGKKQWNWLKQQDRWCGPAVRREIAGHYDKMVMPEGLTPDDVVSWVMEPGDVLWNVMHTPHWVSSVGGTSYSFNLVHSGVRCDGRLSQAALEWEEIKRERELARAQTAGSAM